MNNRQAPEHLVKFKYSKTALTAVKRKTKRFFDYYALASIREVRTTPQKWCGEPPVLKSIEQRTKKVKLKNKQQNYGTKTNVQFESRGH